MSLQQRVNEYLRGMPLEVPLEQSEVEVADSIHSMLQKAEKDLEAAKERVDRLKWELAKAQS